MNLIRSFWLEPRPNAAPRSAADWKLLAVLLAAILVEVLVREDLGFGSRAVLVTGALTATVLWRRSHPLLTVALAFGVTAVLDGADLVAGLDRPDLNTVAFLLILPYALFRWGAGREAVLGLAIVLGSAAIGMAGDDLTVGETFGGFAVLLTPVALGTAVRYREAARLRELTDVRSGERLRLARELHDTVAHHVSAIAVRAQAGVATAERDPRAAVESLRVIGGEASRTLQEMRKIVRALRDDDGGELAPAPRVEDLSQLAGVEQGRTQVEVEVTGSTNEVSPAISGALYRLAQEAITNARRHARGATRILVGVAVDPEAVRLRVDDDGEPTGEGAGGGGYGLIGMAERAQLLGGTFRAGPKSERGWEVVAVLPRNGVERSS